LLRYTQLEHYECGKIIFNQGDVGDLMYVIIKGGCHVRIRVLNSMGEYEERVVTTLYDGINFGDIALEARLLYDSADLREVPFQKAKPMEYKCHINETGSVATFEIRPMVLTSQMEDMYFLVAIAPIDPLTKIRLDANAVLSEPIKVVSKPEQARRKTSTTEELITNSKKKKRTYTDESFTESLARMETQIKQQQELLLKISQVAQQNSIQNCAILKSLSNQQAENVDMEACFMRFFEAFMQTNPSERPLKMKKAIDSAPCKDLTELAQVFGAASPAAVLTNQGENVCNCLDCPHKKELDKMDDFFTIMNADI